MGNAEGAATESRTDGTAFPIGTFPTTDHANFPTTDHVGRFSREKGKTPLEIIPQFKLKSRDRS
ncbi:hypothetical protein J6590_050460 [Homalodisca vitripennis]|nr:hypothetical protein J6590_092482 [Homalodisca vitripennis]KAG8321212.1 hypothetical protein J6590_050460 [Homalodisca vitripennis]